MKKILSLLIAVCLTALCVSCNKDSDNNSTTPTPVNPSQETSTSSDGVYHPSKKISKLTTRTDYNGNTYGSIEVWKWSNNNLGQVSSYDYNGDLDEIINFTYENNRLSLLQYGLNTYLEYHYDGNNLATADYYAGGSLYRTYTFTHTNGNITKVEDQRYNNWKSSVDKNDVLKPILGKDLAQIISKTIQRHEAKSGSKEDSKYVYNLTWKNGNVIKVVFSKESDPSWTVVLDAEYDSNNNPFYGWFWTGDEDDGFVLHSKNNVTKMTYTETDNNDTYTATVSLTYTYNGKYPMSRHYVVSDGYSFQTDFEYLN